jgi:hypothetical protein
MGENPVFLPKVGLAGALPAVETCLPNVAMWGLPIRGLPQPINLSFRQNGPAEFRWQH